MRCFSLPGLPGVRFRGNAEKLGAGDVAALRELAHAALDRAQVQDPDSDLDEDELEDEEELVRKGGREIARALARIAARACGAVARALERCQSCRR